MADRYLPKKIEKKWQQQWERRGVYRQYHRTRSCYVLDMFPYPSGAGLHVGHPKGYIASDVYARFKQLQGYGVLHPMGWDAFGLPAEQYAIKNHVHPAVAVRQNIATFKRQLQKMGFTYDWDREINTTDPEYYRWTQWIFLQMWKHGLAYESHEPINWCPSCQTGLANEDLEQGRCERCDSIVEKRPMRQWVLRITDYADKMLRDLRRLEWPEGVKEAQRNWIGRSEGAEIVFSVAGSEEEIRVFTTRLDTIYGCTSVVVAPEHPLLKKVATRLSNLGEVQAYLETTKKKTDLERTEMNKEKTGVCLQGVEATHPFTQERLPIFVADYVLLTYGTGAVMSVPAHDERDAEFARNNNVPIKQSVAAYFTETAGKDVVRPDKSTIRRKTAYAFVKHWSEDKYLCLEWERFGWHSGIIGGIEEGEDPIAAAQREIIEETGYQHPEFIRTVGVVTHNHFFAAHKDINRYAEGIGMLFKLTNDTWQEPKVEETENHKTVWIPKEKMRTFLNLKNFQYMWDVLETGRESYADDGILINSGEYTGLSSAEAREKMMVWLRQKKLGKPRVNYKMRDWVFSRQRYWGEPIPLIHCEDCGVVPVPEKELPVKLPKVKAYQPAGTGESPLATIEKWVKVKCPRCQRLARRETNTMPQWAGSSWYYLRYIDPRNEKSLVDKRKEKKMMPVNVYVGGDHATRHLIYARFWHKFLFDLGVVSTPEPFKRLEFLGLILAADGRKMSKRWGNVVNPDDVIDELGADAFRTYEMFMGPFDQAIAWNSAGVVGARRFLEKVWKLRQKVEHKRMRTTDKVLETLVHQTIKKVTEDIEGFRFNTAVSALMILVNALEKQPTLPVARFETLLVLLAPFAPHITEELWEQLGHKQSLFLAAWPTWNKRKIQEEKTVIVVQVNGKVRERLFLPVGTSETELREAALGSERVKSFTIGKEVHKVVIVPGKLVNIVV